jgi:hypothetical protein
MLCFMNLWIFHAPKRRYWFIILFILWNLQTKRIGIKENLLHKRCSSIRVDSNRIYFIFFIVVFYLLWFFKNEEWISTNDKGSSFSASWHISSLNNGHRHGLARRCAARGLRRRATEGVSPAARSPGTKRMDSGGGGAAPVLAWSGDGKAAQHRWAHWRKVAPVDNEEWRLGRWRSALVAQATGVEKGGKRWWSSRQHEPK